MWLRFAALFPLSVMFGLALWPEPSLDLRWRAQSAPMRATVTFLDDACFGVSMGGPSECAPEAVLVERAEQRCRQRSLALEGYAMAAPCGNGWYRYLDAACCVAPVQGPPSRDSAGAAMEDAHPDGNFGARSHSEGLVGEAHVELGGRASVEVERVVAGQTVFRR